MKHLLCKQNNNTQLLLRKLQKWYCKKLNDSLFEWLTMKMAYFSCTTEYQDKINSCKEKIDKAKAETVTDEELNALQNEMEEKLQSEQQLRQDLR